MKRGSRLPRWGALLAVGAGIGGCAATMPPEAGSNPADPFERMNRHVAAFNENFDKALAEPVARGYSAAVPKVGRECLSNVFDNLQEFANIFNATLQGKPGAVANDAGRLLINSTVGVAGCFDVAKQVGLERNRQNFGITMGKWGIGTGPYLVLPVLGPSSARQAAGLIPDYFVTDPLDYLRPIKDAYILGVARLVSDRAELLDASKLVEAAALDRYEFVRDGYLQRLRSRVYDGNPPPLPVDEDPDSPEPVAPAAHDAPAAPATALPKQ